MRGRLLWLVAGVALVLAAAASVALAPGPSAALDPASAAPGGSKALATVLAGYGVRVHATHDLAAARGRVVVVAPADYTRTELRDLARRADLVVFGATRPTLAALGVRGGPAGTVTGATPPGCTWPAARAAGPVDLPGGTRSYSVYDVASCYRGAVLRGPGWVVLGTSRLLRNDTVARAGVAALDVNAISADRSVSEVTWLLPGSTATARAAPTTWALFPGGARRAFLGLAALGVLLGLWRGRRFGRVVTEPLPVVVRAAEVVEGHGRLYHRASARDRAAAALRAGARQRLAERLGVPRGGAPEAVVAATAERTGRPDAEVGAVLLGPVPHDDAALIRLAITLDDLQAAAETGPVHPIGRTTSTP